MLGAAFNFMIPVQNFGGASAKKNFRGQKHAKFGPTDGAQRLREKKENK